MAADNVVIFYTSYKLGCCCSFKLKDIPVFFYFLHLISSFFLIFKFYFIYFFIQQVLISHQFYTHQCIHVNPSLPIHHTTTPNPHPRCFPPLVSIRLFSTSVSQFLPCKLVHLYYFSRFHIYVLICDICFSHSDLLHFV